MIEIGLTVECQHHEVATAGQCEIDMKFDTLLAMADNLMKYKYVVKNVATQERQDGDLHAQAALRRQRLGHALPPVDLERRASPCSPTPPAMPACRRCASWYIGGLLKHAPAILAFAAPTTNSYRRLVPGYEAPVNLAWSLRNRSAACRIPMYSDSPKAKRVEFRCPDPSCNPYLAFAAMLMAGLDGIRNKIDPGDPVDKNIYDLPPEELADIKQVPGSLPAALDALEADHDFLLEGDVFTPDLIDNFLDYKRIEEIDPIRLRPHPYEFFLYYDV